MTNRPYSLCAGMEHSRTLLSPPEPSDQRRRRHGGPHQTQNTHNGQPQYTRTDNRTITKSTILPLRRRDTRTYPPESARAARSTAEAPWRPPSSPRALRTGHRAMLWLCFPGTWQVYQKNARRRGVLRRISAYFKRARNSVSDDALMAF